MFLRFAMTALFAATFLWVSAQPTFLNVGSDITLTCGDELPSADGVTAASDCEGLVVVSQFVEETGNIVASCDVTTAFGPGVDWAVWLPVLDAPSVAWNFVGERSLTFYANGTGRLTGTIQNAANSAWQMSVDMRFENGLNWGDWNDLGRGYKNDLGLAGTNYLDWMYYELNPSFSHFSGIGILEGSELSLQHLPTNYYYGFQVGVGSNNKNANDGMSGWFTYNGVFNGDAVSGNGDVNVDRSCETPEQGCGASEFTYTYRAEDACGNIAYAARVITFEDTEAPVFGEIMSPMIVACADAATIYAEADDACSEVTITYSDEVIEEGCPGVISRTYTATDGCGNASTATQTIYLVDGGEPEFTVFPEDITIDCSTIADADVDYTAVCPNTTLTSTDEIIAGSCPSNYTILRTYTLSDACGNTVSQTWTIQVEDNEAPIMGNVPLSADLSCGDEVPAGEPTAADNCSEFTITADVVTETQSCGYITTTTWTATDACGNSSTASQVVTFTDGLDPEFSFIPPSITVTCGELVELQEALATDNCSSVTVVYTDEPLNDCGGSFIRTWRAFDGCGNQASESTVVTIVDNEAPVLVGIPDVAEGSCGGTPPSANVTAIDNCDSEVSVVVEEESVPGNCGSIVTYTWTATDACGNVTSEQRTYALTDNVGPEFELPLETIYANCGDAVADLDVPSPVVTDACSEVVSIEYTDEEIAGDCGSQIVRIYTATDGCGNSSTAERIIVFEDTTAPVFVTVPENIVSACGENDTQLPVVEDNCSDVTIAFEDEISDAQGCSGSLIRHWIATDACGNTSTYDQEITYSDNTPPVIVAYPDDMTAGCDQVPAADTDLIVFEDNCSDATTSFADVLIPGGCPGGYNIERTYTVTDACGNSVSVMQTIFVVDELAPILYGVPADTVLICGDELPYSETFATDNCSNQDDIILSVEDQLISTSCGSTLQRIYSASDACGNTTSIVQEITYIDNAAPVFVSVPEEVTIYCGEETILEEPVAEDDCSVVTITEEQYTIGGCGNSYVRIFTATDGCGNWSTAEQVVNVIDETAPTFDNVPQTILLSCGDDAPEADAVANDACGNVVMSSTDEVQTFGCGYQIMRVYTATDECGNSADFVQIIVFEDNDGPVFLATPENLTLSCGDEIPAAEELQATDVCSEPSEITYEENIEQGDCAGSYILSRFYTATDLCGNTTTIVQTITFTDTAAPVFEPFPAQIELPCGGLDDIAVTATDNCAGDVVISFQDSNTSGTGCGVIQRIYTATDACGNVAIAEQTIVFGDQVAPEFTAFPADGDVACDAVTPTEEVSIDYIDDCSNVTVSWIEEIVPGDCENSYTLIRTCTLSDACGNETTASYVLNVSDTEAPQIIGVSGDLILDCGDQIPNDNVVVIDNCSAFPQISLTETTETIGCTTILLRRWNAIDDCGNVSQQVQIVTFQDQTAPVLSEYPESIVLDCGAAVPDAPSVSATDNCSGDVEVLFSENLDIEGGCGTIQRTWCAEDCTGNLTCHTQTISFQQTSQMPPISTAELRTWQEAVNRIAIQYTANQSGRWGVDVYDLNGRLVTNLFAGEMNGGEMRSMVIDADQFMSGVYIIQFGNGENKVTNRLPIVR